MNENQNLLLHFDEIEEIISSNKSLPVEEELLVMIQTLRTTINSQANISLRFLREQAIKLEMFSNEINNEILKERIVSLATTILERSSRRRKKTASLTKDISYGNLSGDPTIGYPRRGIKKTKKNKHEKIKKPKNNKPKEK